jgi:7-carboxy-7-deazaguanine synthase
VALLRVSELFASLQGEGPSLGQPCTFLRLGDCNLNCHYCDTRYSWDWRRYNRREELAEREVSEVAARICDSNLRRLVVTGGEPLLQQASLEELLEELVDFFVEVETNGTLMPSDELLRRVHQWNVSPKLSNSGIGRFSRIKLDVLERLRDSGVAWLKWVLSDPDQLIELEEIVTTLAWPRERVVLMPQAQCAEELAGRAGWVADLALRNNYRFSTRLQLLLWGNVRGR